MDFNVQELEGKYGVSINAIVDQKDNDYQGIKAYKTVQEAVNNVKENAGTIFITKGTYYEKLEINIPSVTLIGEDREETVLTYDVASGTEKEDGTTYGTFESASVIVKAPNFTAHNLTFENGFDYMAEYRKLDDDPTKVKNIQAVAFRTTDESDRTKLVNCRFKGNQDTLLVDKGTHYFKDCIIEGNVDFIFGAGKAVFETCDIISLDRGDSVNNGFITAASTSINTPYGYIFESCNLLKESAKMESETVYLGRPWHPGGDPDAEASVLFYQCKMDGHIKTDAWTEMGGFSPMDARLFEYESKGPGAKVSDNRRVLKNEEATAFREYLRNQCVR
ncbi:pectinesterase [Gracilibacillus ureilyticus]|uniref:Pectinesterase n=1 Tax=Gracilibacillus ureilyticus TaxID=531814 RepID=A0A1H9NFR4_9BACI|nr:pectinesterase family protein [Gracilibacillus ureilyticus]SER34790.1 pectinesterase [Gracilibacillus ureilyticus]